MIDFGLRGKGAVVSGAGYLRQGAGHGRLCALMLAQAGATVACIDISARRAAATADEIKAAGGKAFPIIADMCDPVQVQRAIDEAAEGLASIDVCVDIIGEARWERVEKIRLDDWNWAIQKNLSQVFYLFQTVGQKMIAQRRGGAMVALASVDGINAAALHAPYGAAKAGVISLAKSFGQELGRHGIRVNAVSPGNVGQGNEDWPEGQWAVNGVNPLAPPRTRDIAHAILFLVSALAERITGQTLIVDGGATVRELWGVHEDMIERYSSGDFGDVMPTPITDAVARG